MKMSFWRTIIFFGDPNKMFIGLLHEIHYMYFLFDHFYIYIFGGDFLVIFVLYSTLLHLPPLRFNFADGYWDRTKDRCNWCIGSQTL